MSSKKLGLARLAALAALTGGVLMGGTVPALADTSGGGGDWGDNGGHSSSNGPDNDNDNDSDNDNDNDQEQEQEQEQEQTVNNIFQDDDDDVPDVVSTILCSQDASGVSVIPVNIPILSCINGGE